MERRRIAVILSGAGMLAASCTAGSTAETPTSETAQPSSSVDAPFSTIGTDPDDAQPAIPRVFADGPLVDVCGDSIVVQASNYPDVGAGPLYSLLGATPTVDVDREAVSAPLIRSDGEVDGVTLEIRSGGPAVGFRSAVAVMLEDESVDLALASMAVAVRDRELLATRAVASLTDRSRDAVIIDPATYPDVTDLAAVGTNDIELRHVTDAPVITFLTANGVVSPDQLIAGSDGRPASFVEADGALTQQGDLTIEPALLPTLPQWDRPVLALPASAAGWSSLDDLLLVDAETDRVADECLGRFVRVVQRAIVAYVADPGPTNAVMSDVRSRFNPLTRLTPDLLATGTRLAIDAAVFDLSRNDSPGTIATDGLDSFLVALASALEVAPVTAEELIDADFVDQTISR